MTHTIRLSVALATIVLVLSASFSICSQPDRIPFVRIRHSMAKAFDPDINGNDQIEWYEAMWWYIGWVLSTGDPEIP